MENTIFRAMVFSAPCALKFNISPVKELYPASSSIGCLTNARLHLALRRLFFGCNKCAQPLVDNTTNHLWVYLNVITWELASWSSKQFQLSPSVQLVTYITMLRTYDCVLRNACASKTDFLFIMMLLFSRSSIMENNLYYVKTEDRERRLHLPST